MKESLNKLKNEGTYLIYIVLAAIVLFKLIFYKESFIVSIRTVIAFFWLFILPGFYFLYYWHNKLGFIERIIISVPVSVSVLSIVSYYLGLMGLDLKYHAVILPVLFLIADFILIFSSKQPLQQKQKQQ